MDFMNCMKGSKYDSHQCRAQSQAYLRCRMDKLEGREKREGREVEGGRKREEGGRGRREESEEREEGGKSRVIDFPLSRDVYCCFLLEIALSLSHLHTSIRAPHIFMLLS